MPSKPGKIRVGIVGLDHWYAGLGAAEQAARNDRVELVAIAHRDERRGRETAERFGAEEFTLDYEAVATRADLDVVVTACYCSENARLASAAARAGSHILSVKPIAMSNEEADQIAQAVQAAGVRFMSWESQYRLNPVFQTIKRWVDEGRIGRVAHAYTILRSALVPPWPGERGRTWWTDATKAPGGGWIDHAIYHVDFLRWLLGDEVARASGEVANLVHPDLAPLEDFGIATLTFRGGAVASIEVTWTAPPGAGLNQYHFVGTEGQIVWDQTVSGKLALCGRTDPRGWLLTSPSARSNSALDHMVDAIANDTPTVATIDDARANLAASFAFYEAARTGRPVAL